MITDRQREIRRHSYHKRRAEGKPTHPNALKTRPYDEKIKARRYMQAAIRLGWISKPLCEGCGTSKNVDAHHTYYSKPYEVDWLCRICHAAAHRGELIRRGPKAPPILIAKPCFLCGADVPRSELRGARASQPVICSNCKVTKRRCNICGNILPIERFSNSERRCRDCNAKRAREAMRKCRESD